MVICASWMRGVSVDGTLMMSLDNSRIRPPSEPVKATVVIAFSWHVSNAFTILAELPEVDKAYQDITGLPYTRNKAGIDDLEAKVVGYGCDVRRVTVYASDGRISRSR